MNKEKQERNEGRRQRIQGNVRKSDAMNKGGKKREEKR